MSVLIAKRLLSVQDLVAKYDLAMDLSFNEHKNYSGYESEEYYKAPVFWNGIQYHGDSNFNMELYDNVHTIDYSKDIWKLRLYPTNRIAFQQAISNDLLLLLEWGEHTLKTWEYRKKTQREDAK